MNDCEEEKYDAIIDINSIRNLKTGWKISYYGNKNIKNIIKSSENIIISILGHSNRGKTYILQKICDTQLRPGYEITTKGISIKVFGKNALLLDTVGTNAPLLVENPNEDDPRDKEDFQRRLDDINLCQIITNHIVQNFVIKYADILICVVGMLTSSEQQFLNRIKKNCLGKKQLIVIHNLIHFYTKEEILNYIENTLKKSIIHNFIDIPIPGFNDENKDYFNKFYIEKAFEDNNKDDINNFNIRHFIMANDTNENDDEIRAFNMPTISYIRSLLIQKKIKKVNILEKLKEHIETISNQVLNKKIKEVIYQEEKDNDYLIYKEDIEPKEVTADELNNISFVGKEYEPPYRYYVNEKEKKFVIEIKICSDIKKKSLNVTNNFENNEFKFIISGERDLDENCNSNNKNIIHMMLNKRTWTIFRLEFKVNLDDLNGVDGMDVFDENDYKIEYGILYLKFNIE